MAVTLAHVQPSDGGGTHPTGALADVETSSEDYARRFAGPVGAFFLEVQTRLTLELLRPWPRARVLDVGGGHAQTIGPLVAAGFEVTVLGSSPACAARLEPWLTAGTARFACGNPLALPYAAGAFDIVLSYRLLPHIPEWPRLLHELARVARQAVLVDYPTVRSVNVLAHLLFGLKRRVEQNTRPYLLFRDAQVAEALAQAGARVSARRGQFVFPMALHRATRNARLARGLEAGAAALGLRHWLGSPVILRAERG
jgi:SAM-dependent methyltransferase